VQLVSIDQLPLETEGSDLLRRREGASLIVPLAAYRTGRVPLTVPYERFVNVPLRTPQPETATTRLPGVKYGVLETATVTIAVGRSTERAKSKNIRAIALDIWGRFLIGN
jgi:hypothetical protein